MAHFKLWQRLFGANEEATELALHVAGATSRSHNPFEQLVTLRNPEALTQAFIQQWVIGYYMASFHRLDAPALTAFTQAAQEITPDVVSQLLGDFNWRTRLVGAYFAAIKGYEQFTDSLGVHLLQSEVCYAGVGYALAFATFRSERARDYLQAYLDYYLKRHDLWYDQVHVLAALHIVDPVIAATYSADWQAYSADKPHHDLEGAIESIRKSIEAIAKIRTTSSQ